MTRETFITELLNIYTYIAKKLCMFEVKYHISTTTLFEEKLMFITHAITTTGAVAYSNAYFGRGTGPILLDDLLCTGSEARLIDCPRYTSQGIGTYDFCPNGHGEDAGVRCAMRKSWFKCPRTLM